MAEKRKPLAWYWWTVAGLMLWLVVYPLSNDPVCWVMGHLNLWNTPLTPLVERFYQPAAWAYHSSPEWLENAWNWYGVWE